MQLYLGGKRLANNNYDSITEDTQKLKPKIDSIPKAKDFFYHIWKSRCSQFTVNVL